MIAENVVDAHHHLWDLSAVDYPWLLERGTRRFFGDPLPIQRNYEVKDFRDDHLSCRVVKSVHVQVGARAGAELDETRWLDLQAQQTGLPSAIVAFCNLLDAAAPKMIEDQMAASHRIRGIRQIISRHADEDREEECLGLLSDKNFEAHLRLLGSLGLSFDLQLTPPYMLVAAELLERIEDLEVALCHMGSPWRRDREGLGDWAAGLKRLADNPRVTCKLSGVGMFDPDWTTDSLKPVVETVLETFGAERVMWGSNFPVDKLYRGYEQLFCALSSLLPKEMHPGVFRETAERFYKL
jgi:predicted TIM-barrel fold metal-dependent hydrolase